MLPFNFHHLYYFYCIVKYGSVSRAAKELRLSQPALSYQLKSLQEYLGIRLFRKEGRKLVLTEEGHSALSYAKQIFDAGKELSDSLRDRSQKGRIRIQIGVMNSIPKTFANALLKFILTNQPDAHVQLYEDTFTRMIEDLKDHSLDMLLTDTPCQASVEEEIQNHLIAKVPVVFCAHPSLAKKYKKIPADLHNAPMILTTADSRVFHSVQEYLADHRIAPRVVAEIQDIELAHVMAMDKMGIVSLNSLMALNTPKDKLAVIAPGSKTGIFESIYVINKKRRNPHPLVEKVISKFRL